MKKFWHNLILDVFYELKYVRKPDRQGYHVVKRWYLWAIFFPIVIIVMFIPVAVGMITLYIKSLRKLDNHWIATDERVLSREERLNYKNRLR